MKNAVLYVLCCWLLACTSNTKNRLVNASSPYLQQHADNPVDWYEWGEEALALAEQQNKPLLISIGYASCHYCHKMEKESFMDTAVARIMNEQFICIKVDREERPDIDQIYMNACELLTGNAGWPLNAFALPDGKPFYAGTYFEKEPWIRLLTQISDTYRNQPGKVRLQAQSLSTGIAKLELDILMPDSSGGFSTGQYQQLMLNMLKEVDSVNGGIKGAPKFPMPFLLDFLLQSQVLTGNEKPLNIALLSLDKMATGGIYDQLGGGFCRYTTDSVWQVPHFEKMLYDNAQLLSVYAHAFQLTKSPFYERIIRETIGFLLRDLKAPGGGYYSSLNADTNAGEGWYYSWTPNEINAVLGKDAATVSAYYQVTDKGNWEGGRSLLIPSSTPIDTGILSKSNQLLLKARTKREQPVADTKILCAWNAALVKGLTDAYRAIGDSSFLQEAISLARFMDAEFIAGAEEPRLKRSAGAGGQVAFLEDYMQLIQAYIELYQVGFDLYWLNRANALMETALKLYHDPSSGMFYYAAATSSANLIRKISLADNALPASNAIAAQCLYQLGLYYDREPYRNMAEKMLSTMQSAILNNPPGFYGSWGQLAGWFSYGVKEVAIMGPQTGSLAKELHQHYLPLALHMGHEKEENLPLLKGKLPVAGSLIYVCSNGTCKRPVSSVSEALKELRMQQ